MVRRPFLFVLFAAFACAAPALVVAQASPSDTLSIQDRRALLSARIAVADSSADLVAAVNARLDLALISGPNQALRQTQEAVALADNAPLAPEVALRAHRALVDLYTGLGEMTKANREWVQVLRFSDEVWVQRTADAVKQARTGGALAAARADSLKAAVQTERAVTEAGREALTSAYQQRTMVLTIAVAAVCTALLLAAILFGWYMKRLRAELKELRQEVTWLRMVGKKAAEPKVELPQVAPQPAPAPALAPPLAVVQAPPRGQEDTMLLELVRRRGVERLGTLREARQRGDREKVVRVVHSLKPQLVSIDAGRFVDLCARLVTVDAPADNGQWNADLDALEDGIEQLLAPRS